MNRREWLLTCVMFLASYTRLLAVPQGASTVWGGGQSGYTLALTIGNDPIRRHEVFVIEGVYGILSRPNAYSLQTGYLQLFRATQDQATASDDTGFISFHPSLIPDGQNRNVLCSPSHGARIFREWNTPSITTLPSNSFQSAPLLAAPGYR